MLRCASLLVLFTVGCLPVLSQQTQQPQAPAAQPPEAPVSTAPPSRPMFAVPHISSTTLIDSTGRTPPPAPSTAQADDFCGAPAEGLYSAKARLTDFGSPDQQAAVMKQLRNYESVAQQRIETMWEHGMPRAANDPWFHKAVVTVRFAILPSGDIDPPIVTTSSGRASYDHHALEAVRQAGPFGAMPAGMTQAVPICYRFGYHVAREDMLPKVKDPLPYSRPTPQP